jgi:hypothetical protein
VRLAPGATGTVEVLGRTVRCAERAARQLTEKVGQRFRYHSGGDEHTQNVDLDAYLEIVTPAARAAGLIRPPARARGTRPPCPR